VGFTLAFALQLREKQGKTSVRVGKTSVRVAECVWKIDALTLRKEPPITNGKFQTKPRKGKVR